MDRLWILLRMFSTEVLDSATVKQSRSQPFLDSSVGRASAFGAGGRGFESRGRTIPKV